METTAAPQKKRGPTLDGMLNVRLTLDQLAELHHVADELGVHLSVVARRAVVLGTEPAHRDLAADIEAAEAGE